LLAGIMAFLSSRGLQSSVSRLRSNQGRGKN
jgi:hypothetical protein